MTRTSERLGAVLDKPPTGYLGLQYGTGVAERDAVAPTEDEARRLGQNELATELGWERGIMDLNPLRMPAADLFPNDRESYCAFYGLTPEAREYALLRAGETQNPVLRIHHLAYARASIPQTGREWAALTRRLALALRDYIAFVANALPAGADGADAAPILEALPLTLYLYNLPGIFTETERSACVRWLITIAQQLRDHEWDVNDYNRPHRWPFAIVRHLITFPAELVSPADRATALRMVSEAITFFSATPLASSLTTAAIAAEHELRRHFGETGTHAGMVRRTKDAITRDADFFAAHGNRLGAALLYRDATKLMTTHSQSFGNAERADARRHERNFLAAAVAKGDFTRGATVHFDMTPFAFAGATPEATVDRMVASALSWVPLSEDVALVVDGLDAATPLGRFLRTTTMTDDRVVNEAVTPTQLRENDEVRYLVIHAEAIGTLIHATLTSAVTSQGLSASHVLTALHPLPLPPASIPVLKRGITAFLNDDPISAVHILTPLIEESIRCLLRTAGIETSVFRTVDEASGASRTDDAALGELLHISQGDKSAATILGPDLVAYIAALMVKHNGLNLRNKVAHGLARANDCTPPHAGLLLHILVCLAARVVADFGAPPQR